MSQSYLFFRDKQSTWMMAYCKFLFEMYRRSERFCSDSVFNVCEVGTLTYCLLLDIRSSFMQWEIDSKSFFKLLFWCWSMEFWAIRFEKLIYWNFIWVSSWYLIEDSLMSVWGFDLLFFGFCIDLLVLLQQHLASWLWCGQ